MNKEKATVLLQERLEISEAAATELLDRAEEYFLSETGRLTIPGRAFWLWLDLAADLHQQNTGQTESHIASVKRGDTAITYQEGEHSPALDLLGRVARWRVAKAR